MKILYVLPHCSTGGMPQYSLDLIKKIKNDVDVYCIEYSTVSFDYVVQRNQLIQLLKERFYSINENKDSFFSILREVNPDVIHLQEVPEYFMSDEVAKELYDRNRTYKIVETSHDSSFNIHSKRHIPDQFALISQYQIKLFEPLGVPISLIEADIEYKERQNREEGLRKLSLDPNIKHVLTVGLFTPRKNQAEVIEYARKLQGYPIQFHFVGNQADNFKFYWEPLMKDLPSNVKIWGERSDVDSFYSCMDLMLFTSKGTGDDKETSPLVIREAIGWNIPSLIYNLPVYMGMYDGYKCIKYLDEKTENNLQLIMNSLGVNYNIDSYQFDVQYDSSNNSVYIFPKQNSRNTLLSVRDIDSTAVIWSTYYEFVSKDLYYTITPTPKSFIDFETDPYFGGLTVEIYEDNHLVYSKDFRIKTPIIEKPKLILKNNSEPVFMNYSEFFIERIYDKYLKGNNYKTVIDVGANVGMWSCYLNTVSNVERIYAIEPNKKAIKILKQSNLPNVVVLEKALVDSDKELDFFTNNDNSLISSITQYGDLSSAYKVDGISFKTLLKSYDIQHIDLLKVDIETGEYDLFNSLDAEDLSKIDSILVEFHIMAGRTFEKDVTHLVEIIKNAGFQYEVNHLHDIGGYIFAKRPEISILNNPILEVLENNPCSGKRELASLVNMIHPNGVGVEIGVLRGDYSKIILDRWKSGTLYLIDTWRHMSDYIDMNGRDDQYHYNCMVQTATNIKEHQDRAHMIRMDSDVAADLFPDEHFDFIYIDADHSYEAVVKDLKSWWPKIKKGGIFAGDDYIPDDGDIWLINNADGSSEYAGKFGVRKAVTEFATQHGLKIYSTTEEPYWKQWYTIKPF